jgi:hypothetical protein
MGERGSLHCISSLLSVAGTGGATNAPPRLVKHSNVLA